MIGSGFFAALRMTGNGEPSEMRFNELRTAKKHRPCRLESMADKVVKVEESFTRNVPQEWSRHHGGVHSVNAERQRLAAGTARPYA